MSAMVRCLLSAALIFFASNALADTIRMYTSGEKSLAARFEAIRRAKRSIDIVTYDFKPCHSSTKALIGLLAGKAKDGVSVRVLLDDFELSKQEKAGVAAYFRSQGIELKIYNQSFFLGQNHRNHIKLTLIDPYGDRPVYFADSSNYSDEYFGMNSERNYVNRDFKIEGASAAQAAEAFEMLWTSRPSKPAKGGTDLNAFYNSCLKQNNRDLSVAKYFTENAAALAEAPGYTCSKIKYVADNPRFQDAGLSQTEDRDNRNEEYMNELRLKKKLATASFLQFVDGAGSVLNVENQYYIPVYRMKYLLHDLRDERGVSVVVLTNMTGVGIDETSTRQISWFINRAARRDSKGGTAVLTLPSLGRLAKRHPLTPKGGGGSWHLHSKSMVRDHRDVWMGSFNIDPRSYHTNLEYAVTVRGCPTLAAAIERDYKRMIENYKADLRDCRACKGETEEMNPFETLGAFFKQNFL